MANYQAYNLITLGSPSQTTSILRGTFTLQANATSTTVTAKGCLPVSICLWRPSNQHAANDGADLSCIEGTDQFVLTHASNARTDRQFNFVLFI